MNTNLTNTIQSIARSFGEDLKSAGDVILLHSTVGRYLRNHYSLWKPETPLAVEIQKVTGYTHPDEMSDWLLREAKKLVK